MVVPNGPVVSEARFSDFMLGSIRVRKHYDGVLAMRNAGVPAAWMLVSAYYSAFFACVELCKLVNKISMSFEDRDLEALKAKSVGSFHADFFRSGNMNFLGFERAGALVFQSSGAKPHAVAWDSVRGVVKRILGDKGWPEALLLIEMLENSECSPSLIRNNWNYRRSDYYGVGGEKIAREFKTLIGNQSGALAWLKRSRGRIAPQDPCVVAFLCETLSSAIADAGTRAGSLVSQST